MLEINLIIFDLDGTLIDSTEDIAAAVNFTLKKLGLEEKSQSEIRSYIGWGVEDMMRKSLGKNHREFLNKSISILENYYRKQGISKAVLYPNTKETLEHFKNKKKAIVSNRKHEFINLILKHVNIFNYFEYIVGGDDIDCLKPSSCPLDKAMGKFNIKKDKAIIVGDMGIDIEAGKNAGILTCGVTYGIGKKEDIVKAKPDFIINDLLELKNIIK